MRGAWRHRRVRHLQRDAGARRRRHPDRVRPAPDQAEHAARERRRAIHVQVRELRPERRDEVTGAEGFHLRPATAFAQLAGQFQSTVTVCKGDQRINGKSALELLILAAEKGTEVVLEVSGSDARFTWIDEAFLLERGVQPWSELPLWVPRADAAFLQVDCRRAWSAGLRFRALERSHR